VFQSWKNVLSVSIYRFQTYVN